MTSKASTRASLQAQVDSLQKELEAERTRRRSAEDTMRSAQAAEKETRSQFVDLKERLVTAEAENQRMRGYIARVQEDDVVREELVTVGEPEGEQHFVPKRKVTPFSAPNSFNAGDTDGFGTSMEYARARPRPRHWVTY